MKKKNEVPGVPIKLFRFHGFGILKTECGHAGEKALPLRAFVREVASTVPKMAYEDRTWLLLFASGIFGCFKCSQGCRHLALAPVHDVRGRTEHFARNHYTEVCT